MCNVNTFSSSDDSDEQRYLLPDNIAAMEIIPSTTGEPGLGPVLRIPEGAEIEYCGEGFSKQTVKVRWRGKFYFVFRDDLPTQRGRLAQRACC
jgi:hypothetical protein